VLFPVNAGVVEAFISVFADFLDCGPRTVNGGRPATVSYAGALLRLLVDAVPAESAR
jgi:hypothetical protein